MWLFIPMKLKTHEIYAKQSCMLSQTNIRILEFFNNFVGDKGCGAKKGRIAEHIHTTTTTWFTFGGSGSGFI